MWTTDITEWKRKILDASVRSNLFLIERTYSFSSRISMNMPSSWWKSLRCSIAAFFFFLFSIFAIFFVWRREKKLQFDGRSFFFSSQDLDIYLFCILWICSNDSTNSFFFSLRFIWIYTYRHPTYVPLAVRIFLSVFFSLRFVHYSFFGAG